jgi:hypothetical protein
MLLVFSLSDLWPDSSFFLRKKRWMMPRHTLNSVLLCYAHFGLVNVNIGTTKAHPLLCTCPPKLAIHDSKCVSRLALNTSWMGKKGVVMEKKKEASSN